MLTNEDIQTALVNLVKINANLPYPVHFNRVRKSDKSYIWIEIRASKKSFDGVYFQRILAIDIQTVLLPDEYAEVKYTDLMKISDALDAAIMPCVKIKDRSITVQDFNSYVVDDVLHYKFTLDFTDYLPNGEYDGSNYGLMENLEVDLNKDTSRRVFFVENGDED